MEEKQKKESSCLDVAEKLVESLRQQDAKTNALKQELVAQKEINANLEARVQRLEQEKKDLISTLMRQNVKEETKTKKEEQGTSPKRESFEDELAAMFGRPVYGSPEALLWLLKRSW